MFKSMTGFARATSSSNLGDLNLEINSVNRRFLEVNLFLPKAFLFLENEIKKLVEKKISRGNVFLKFEFLPSEKNIFSLLPNSEYLKNLKKGWEDLSKDLGYKKNEITLEFLLRETKYIPQDKIKNESEIKKLFYEASEKALNKLLLMKSKEGKELFVDVENRIKKIKKELVHIKKLAPKNKKAYTIKLRKKLTEILKDKELFFEDRVLKEAAIFAEKIDITEEIIRLESHLKQFLSISKTSKEAIGRKLDFLLQEFLRETNTIASKSLDSAVAKSTIEIKSQIEKIKEQIQNIE